MKNILIIFCFILMTSILFGQNNVAYIADSPADFKKYNLKPGNIPEAWEDACRTGGKKGTFEWWYFDAHLDDGTTVVIVFYTKPYTKTKKGIIPYITLSIDKPDGTKIAKEFYGDIDEYSASSKECNVVIGENYFRGNLKNYEIHFEDKELQIDIIINRTTESWRPKTGYFHYGNQGDYFAWVVAVPQGETEITYSFNGEKNILKGSCYHDHNWGNIAMAKTINHWYWSRAKIGPYNIIASEFIADKKYNYASPIVFYLSKDGQTIVDNGLNVNLYRTYGKIQDVGGKPLSDKLKFIYQAKNEDYRYEYTLEREKNLVAIHLLDAQKPSKFKKTIIKLLTGFNGAYYRMAGTTNLKVYKNNALIEEYTSNKAVWELMYFGEPYK